MQNNTSCAQTLLTLPVEKTISPLGGGGAPTESLTVLSTDAYIREFLLYYHNKTTFRSRTGNPAG